MPVFLNNCRRRDHVVLFGSGAFYDLECHGRQATSATDLRPGQECVVATPGSDGRIVFNWFAFSHEAFMAAEDGVEVRVLFGDMVRSEPPLSLGEAVAHETYSVFFNTNRHFKRLSVIPPSRR